MELLQQNVTRPVHARSQPSVSPAIGMNAHDEGFMRRSDFLLTRPQPRAKDFMGFLFGNAVAQSAPRVRVSLRVFAPNGLAAVKIRL